MTGPAIETQSLRRRFGDKLAVADLSLTVDQGEVFGFLGPNGAGKTTSLKMLLGLIAPTSGSGRLMGIPIGERRARERVGFLPEHFRFQDWLTGRELLQFHGRLFGMSGTALEQRIEALLARVDLLDAAHQRVSTYSKGMTQRVGLAQALLHSPRLVFLDEPTSGLDPIGRRLVRDIIRELKADGVTVFLNSHLLSEVEQTCDRVVFVKQGRIVREMRLGSEAHGLELELRLGAVSEEAAIALAAMGSGAREEQGRWRLRLEGEAQVADVVRMLVARGVAVYGVRSSLPTLEQMFLEVLGDEVRPG